MAANDYQSEPEHESLRNRRMEHRRTTTKLDIERRLLAEMKLPYTAEHMIDASFAAESSHKTQDAAQGAGDDQMRIGAGAFIARGALGGPAEANEMIEELKRSLATIGKSKEPDELVDLWIRAEPWLDDRELASLWSEFAAKLPGESERIHRSRGAAAQGAGARTRGEGQ